MKKYVLIIPLLLFLKNGWAQNTNLDYKNAIKIYNLTTFEEYERSERLNDTSSNYYVYTTRNLQILHPTIAFQWKTKKNNFHEIELTNFIIDKAVTKTELTDSTFSNAYLLSGSDITTTSIALRYEYILNFFKSKERKLVPSLGFSMSPYFKQNKFSPLVATSFPSSERYIGSRAFVTPRITYYLRPRFFIDLNVPLCVLDAYTMTEKSEDPSIPESERTVKSINFQGLPTIFSGRIGIGLKL
jgi:hypothetical protein